MPDAWMFVSSPTRAAAAASGSPQQAEKPLLASCPRCAYHVYET